MQTIKQKLLLAACMLSFAVSLSAQNAGVDQGAASSNAPPAQNAGVAQRPAAAVQSLTVEQAVRLALEGNLSLRRNGLEAGKKKRSYYRSWNGLIPAVSASGLVSRPTSLTDTIPAAQDTWTPGVQVSASLQLSTALVGTIKAAKADYEAGRLNYEQAAQELEVQVRKLFYQIILLDDAQRLAARSLESARARHEQSAALVRTGQAAHLDELSARVDMENQKPALRNAEMAYANAVDSFKELLGLPVESAITLQGTLDDALARTAAGTADEPAAGVDSTAAGGETLESAALYKSIQSLEAQRDAAWHGAYIPSLQLSWSGAPVYVNDEWHDNAGSFSIMLGVSLGNYLPWSASKSQLDGLNDTIKGAKLQLDEAKRSQLRRIAGHRRTIAKSRETIAALKLNVDLAESAYALYEDAYRKGAADYQRLRDASDSLLQAQNQVQQEQFNLVSALLDMEKELSLPFGSLR
ncbi:MAG: TolC family protein [Spirochaetaceae bacterium]|nr:TolC family protein [Spirochaetaceae bacterium]